MKYILLGLFITGAIGCGKQNSDSENKSCSAVESGSIAVGTSVSSDFNVSSVPYSGTVTTSTCSGIPVNSTDNFTLNSAQRSGTSLSMYDNNNNLIQMTINGTNLNSNTQSASSSGCSITVTYTGSLDTTANKINLTQTMSLTETSAGACGGVM